MAEHIHQKLREIDSINYFEGDYCPFLEIKGVEYKAKYSSFKSIIFQDLVHFENTHISIGLFFEDCTFDDRFTVQSLSDLRKQKWNCWYNKKNSASILNSY